VWLVSLSRISMIDTILKTSEWDGLNDVCLIEVDESLAIEKSVEKTVLWFFSRAWQIMRLYIVWLVVSQMQASWRHFKYTKLFKLRKKLNGNMEK
jgi:hypothetical protein